MGEIIGNVKELLDAVLLMDLTTSPEHDISMAQLPPGLIPPHLFIQIYQSLMSSTYFINLQQ